MERLLGGSLVGRVDDADIYLEYRVNEELVLEENVVKKASRHVSQGAGVRAQADTRTGYAHTDDISLGNLEEAARQARAIADRAGDLRHARRGRSRPPARSLHAGRAADRHRARAQARPAAPGRHGGAGRRSARQAGDRQPVHRRGRGADRHRLGLDGRRRAAAHPPQRHRASPRTTASARSARTAAAAACPSTSSSRRSAGPASRPRPRARRSSSCARSTRRPAR